MPQRFRYGAHMFLWRERWADDAIGLLEHVRGLGLDSLEISVGDDVSFTPSLLRHHAESLNLTITIGPGNLWPMECDISDDEADNRKRGMTWHRRMIQLAAESGAVCYGGALYGHPGRVMRRVPPPDELPRTAGNLHLLAEDAARYGVRLVLEPMSRFRTHLINTAEQAVRLVQMAEHSNLYINLDTYHMMTEERDYGAAMRRVGERLWGIHACENDRGVPGGGLVPWQQVFEALHEVCPDAWIMLETYRTGPGSQQYTRGIFQDVCPDPDAFVRQGLKFLQDTANQYG